MSYPRLTKCLPNECRHNPYFHIHKALRLGHCRLLADLGAHDFSHDAGTRDLMKRLQSLIALSRAHLDAESREIGMGLDARRPSSAPVWNHDPAGHRHALAELESLVRSVNVATPARRNIAGHALYRCFALFAAADMEHMNSEETELLSTLHDLFTDEELSASEVRMLASLPVETLLDCMCLMMPALNHQERIVILSRLRSAMDGMVFDTLIETGVKPVLSPEESRAVLKGLGLLEAA
ncbi:hypothetical protein [Aestuariivirga sp.]|uniref:hypothetical protein n=1 Tax=Aestuariivirga sp. TaxID=2650926 RepID=UPI0035931297